jgi:hypothetical protein
MRRRCRAAGHRGGRAPAGNAQRGGLPGRGGQGPGPPVPGAAAPERGQPADPLARDACEQPRSTLAARLPEDGCQQADTSALPVKHPSRVRGPDHRAGPGSDLATRPGRDAARTGWSCGFRLAVRTGPGSRIVRARSIVPAAVSGTAVLVPPGSPAARTEGGQDPVGTKGSVFTKHRQARCLGMAARRPVRALSRSGTPPGSAARTAGLASAAWAPGPAAAPRMLSGPAGSGSRSGQAPARGSSGPGVSSHAAVKEREAAGDLLETGPPPGDLLAGKGLSGRAFASCRAACHHVSGPAEGHRSVAQLGRDYLQGDHRSDGTGPSRRAHLPGLLICAAAAVAARTLVRVCLADMSRST